MLFWRGKAPYEKNTPDDDFIISKPEDAELAYQKGIAYKNKKANDLTKFIVKMYTERMLVGETNLIYSLTQRYESKRPSIPSLVTEKVVDNIQDILGEEFKVERIHNYIEIKRVSIISENNELEVG